VRGSLKYVEYQCATRLPFNKFGVMATGFSQRVVQFVKHRHQFQLPRDSIPLRAALQLRSCNPFRNASVTNEGGVGNFTIKLVAMAMSFERSGKRGWDL